MHSNPFIRSGGRPSVRNSCGGPCFKRHGRAGVSLSAVDRLVDPIVASPAAKRSFRDANFPMDSEGRTYHLGTKRGEVANRILSVGSAVRAELLSSLLDPPSAARPLLRVLSDRGFLTITGSYQGLPISIISSHMGYSNMDFMVRENRAVVEGTMAVVRLGTAGALQLPAKLGDLMIASHGSISITRNPDAWSLPDHNGAHAAASNGHTASSPLLPFFISRPVPADAELSRLLTEEVEAVVGRSAMQQGLNCSADSFYSSQGRTGQHFDDRNELLISQLVAQFPNLLSLEMETFHLLDLSRCSGGSVRAVGMCVALAERYTNAFLESSRIKGLELAGGRAALSALIKLPLAHDSTAGAALLAGTQ